MKLPCSVVRDLLPVYTEKLVEQETQELIDQHLEECDACRQILSEMKEEPTTPIETVKPLQNLKKQIRRQRWRVALIAALCVFVVLFTYFFHAGSMNLLPWKEGLLEVRGVETVSPDHRIGRTYHVLKGESEDNLAPQNYTGEALVLQTDNSIVGTMSNMTVEDDGTITVFLQALGRDSRNINTGGAAGELVLYPVPDRVIYGYSEPQKLLWGEPLNGGGQVLPRLTLNYYLLIAAGLTVITGALWFVLRKNRNNRIIRQIFFAPLSYVIAHLLICGVKGTTYFMGRNMYVILLIAVAIYFVLSLAWKTWIKQYNIE